MMKHKKMMAGVLAAALTAASFGGVTAFAEDTTSDITLSATVNSSTVKYKLSIPSGKRTIDSAKDKYNEVGTLSVTKFDGETVGFSNTKQVSVTVSYSGSLTNTDTSVTAKNKLAYKLVEGTENSNTDLESGRTYSFSANDINGDSGKSVAIGAVVTGDPAQVENGTYEDKVTFTASVEAADTEVTGVTINNAPAELNVGDTGTLTATVSPEDATNKDVAWSSDNTSVLAINETTGAYEAKAAGTATITAAAGGKTAACTITVKSAAIAVTGITIDNAPTEALFVNSTGTLTATVSPDNATDKTVTWSSSDPDYVSINAETGKYTIMGKKGYGSATITATAGDKTATCTITGKVTYTSLSAGTVLHVGDTFYAGKVYFNTSPLVNFQDSNGVITLVENNGCYKFRRGSNGTMPNVTAYKVKDNADGIYIVSGSGTSSDKFTLAVHTN